MKWTGIGVTEFADLIGVPRIFDWGNLTDARELLKEAAILGHEATVRMLLGKGDQVKDKKTFEADVVQALHYSCFYDNEWVVRACLEYVSDVNAADVTGQTALHKAAQQGNEWVVAALLEFGADLDKRDILGITPLDAALAQGNDAVVRLFMKNRGALIASSKSTPDALLAPVYSVEAPALDRFTGMNATTVDFYVELSTEGYEEHRVTQTAVETLVWGENFGRNDDSERRSKSSHISSDLVPKAASVEPDFKWIHIPANNMLWVEALMAKLYAEHDKKSAAPDLMKPELWSDKQHRSEEFTVHSRFMKPSCRYIQEANAPRENLVLFMPYIHWELEDARNVMSGHVKRLQKLYDEQAKETVKQLALDYFMELMKKDKKERPGDVLSPSTEPDVLLLEDYLFNDPPLHIRRTLDQFHYYTTDNTDVRDSDQVISRYLRRKFPEQPVPLVMIDQLWMWVIDDKTVVTSFPQRWGEHAAGTDFSTFMNTTDVLDSVLRYLDSKFRDPITSASALAESIMTRCLGLSFDRMEWHHERYRYLEIFEYSINYVADEETRCFNHFADRGKESERGKEKRKLEAEKAKKEKAKKKADKKRQKREKSKQNQKGKEETQDNDPGNAEDSKAPEVMKLLGPSALGEELEDIFDISREIELLKEIKDIRDELNILRNLFDQQKRVLESFCPTVQAEQDNINTPAPKQGLNLLAAIQRQIDIVATMDENAKRPYKALEDLLDLKQKQANVSEARIARISGNTITVFTVVTIIFLPASFMAAFLALPITEYPKTEANYPLSYALKYTSKSLMLQHLLHIAYRDPK
ncbi:hypothetical protein B0O99DRAFT_347159 [Bisporella sp. PMI_857]|nr:hypothetical protein B0O99DRAFT_347159 [Bisporella sp. PMI_857]